MTILAGTAVFAACQEKEEDLGPARISVSPTELSFEAPESSKSVELTATRDWTVQSSPDWVALSVSSGEASTKAQTISVSVNENKSNNRDGEVIFTIGLSKATLKVSQVGPGGVLDNGDGTLEKPYSVAGVVEYVNSLGSDVQSSNSVYVKGLVSTVETTFEGSGTYGNATFNMVDSQGSSVVFKAFQTYYLGNRKWVSGDKEVKSGDEVIVYGPVVNYKGNTPETAGKGASFIYSLNGETEGGNTEIDYENAPEKTVAEFLAAADKGTYYKLSGTVGGSINTQYGNFDLTDDTGTVYVYGTKNITEYASRLVAGAQVTLAAHYDYYEKNQKHEAVDAYILSISGGQTPGSDTPADPEGTGTENDPFNVGAAIAMAQRTGETATSEVYYIKGKISSIEEQYGTQFGNATFNLVDEGSNASFKAFRVKYFNDEKWTEGGLQVKVGDEVVICGKIVNFKGNTPETEQGSGYLYSLNGNKGGGDTPGPVDPEMAEPAGTGTEEDPFNVAAAIAKAQETGTVATEVEYYITGTVYGTAEVNGEHGNATFTIIDKGYPSAPFTLYRIKSFGGAAFTGKESIKAGDEVVVKGQIVNYQNKTPEISYAGSVVLINGKTEFDEVDPGEVPDSDFGSNVTWQLGDAAATQTAVVNGTEDVSILKLGTSKKTGSATLSIPSGSTRISFYAISWNKAVSTVVFKAGGKELGTISPAANSGLQNNPPYSLTVSEGDYYEIELDGATTVTVETSGTNPRAVLFGIQAR